MLKVREALASRKKYGYVCASCKCTIRSFKAKSVSEDACQTHLYVPVQ